MQEQVLITKATGEREPFEPQKLRDSLLRAHALPAVAEKIINHIELELRDGMTTQEIYAHAFNLLEQEHKPAATRYSLRNAIMEMGPTGFPFEQLIAEIFRAKGFETRTDFVATGKCVEHEIDVVAWNKEKLMMCEAKFHNQFGIKSDVKAALYVNSRWEDIKDQTFDEFGFPRKLDETLLITNTKFSEQAIKYAECRKMNLVGWNYPHGGNLQDLIEETGLHPITSLRSISSHEKRALMEAGIIHVKQASDNTDVVKAANIPENTVQAMLEEIRQIRA